MKKTGMRRIIAVLLACLLLCAFMPLTAGADFTTAPMAASGGCHSYALKSDGTIWCWGRTSPTRIDITEVTSISASGERRSDPIDSHVLMLKNDGTVWARGENTYGEIGDGTLEFRSVPAPVPDLDGVVSISAGGTFSLALKSDRTVWAWGHNTSGQLGDGTTARSLQPVQVQGLNDITAISSGHAHSIALHRDGTVWAWGGGAAGILGNGTVDGSLTPVHMQNLSGVTAVAAGSNFCLALRNDGTVWGWGENGGGQLGDGTSINRPLPVQAEGLSDVTVIAAGRNHGLAVEKNGTAWGWGSNDLGAVGLGDTTYYHRKPVQVRDLSNVIFVAAGVHNSLAITKDGTVWTWGDKQYAGPGKSCNYWPVKVKNPEGSGSLKVLPPRAPTVFTTKYASNVWNWMMFFVCFGWIWMWFR